MSQRRKDRKPHRSWSIVESRRYVGKKLAHRQALYLEKIKDSQRVAPEKQKYCSFCTFGSVSLINSSPHFFRFPLAVCVRKEALSGLPHSYKFLSIVLRVFSSLSNAL
jgi:hypothetical protein